MWRRSRRSKQPRRQRTETKSLEQLEKNRISFHYPKDGFVVKVEFSLLYAMLIAAPETYPIETVHAMVEEEDFIQYVHTKNGDVSYAQLSAILACSAEIKSQGIKSHDMNSSSTGEEGTDDRRKVQSAPQKLCKKILQVVLQYAEENNLDRETEIDDLLVPVKRVTTQRIAKKEIQAMVPFYLGYSAAVLTANPLPLIFGAAGLFAAPNTNHEVKNMEHIVVETGRSSCVETAGLLDEGEDF